MHAPPEQGGVGHRPRWGGVTRGRRSPRSDLGRERGHRLRAHPLAFDEHDLPIAQAPLPAAERLGRHLAG